MDRVTGGPIKAGAGLAAVVAECVGWAGCRREGGQRRGARTPGGTAADSSRPLRSSTPLSDLGTTQGGHTQGRTLTLTGSAQGQMGASRTLGTAGALAASRTEAGAAHGITGDSSNAVTDAATVHSEEAGRAGCRWGGDGRPPGSRELPACQPPLPRPSSPHPGSPRSQKVPLQPAGQVQAPLTWSQAAPCSHWHRRPQPGPK